MNSIWNKNYCAFKARFPQLAEMLPEPDLNLVANPSFWEITTAKNGMITCSENGLRLHSGYNPQREAFSGISNKEIEEKSATVFYGFGLGYHVVEWAKKFCDWKSPTSAGQSPAGGGTTNSGHSPSKAGKKLILIEPDYKHFYAALSFLDWTDVFKLENLIIAVGCPAESVLPLIEDTSTINVGDSGVSDAYFFTIPAFMAHGKEYFDAVQEIINRNKRKNDINAATLKKFGRLWCRNSVRNLHWMRELSSVNDLKENFTSGKWVRDMAGEPACRREARTERSEGGLWSEAEPRIARPEDSTPAGGELLGTSKSEKKSLPFLIVGAGPSLEKILPHMKELKKRTVIICVETALGALLRVGVQPDFIIITDPQFWAYRHIAGLGAPESILVTEISAYPAVFRFPCKKILLCSSQFPIGQYFQMKLGVEPGDLGTGGSVASSAWNLAYLWGAKEIFTAGLDFAFPENRTHIRGSDAEESFLAAGNKLNTADKMTLGGLFSANAQVGSDYNGNAVVTDSRMKMFSWWFEARLAKCGDVRTFTLCPEGLKTPGFEVASVERLLGYEDISAAKEWIFAEGDCQKDGGRKTLVTGDRVPTFKKMVREFPDEEFRERFPFLDGYL